MTARRFDAGAIGNTVALLAVAALAAWLFSLHGDVEWRAPDAKRALAVSIIIVAYVALCAAIAWPRLRARRVRERVAGDALWIIHASQTGQAEQLAERSAQSLRDAGIAVRVEALGSVRADDLHAMRRALFVASTTGEGDAPDAAQEDVEATVGQLVDRGLGCVRHREQAVGDHEADGEGRLERRLVPAGEGTAGVGGLELRARERAGGALVVGEGRAVEPDELVVELASEAGVQRPRAGLGGAGERQRHRLRGDVEARAGVDPLPVGAFEPRLGDLEVAGRPRCERARRRGRGTRPHGSDRAATRRRARRRAEFGRLR